ncbi:MAG TPA: tyrosine-type recombinase/integrase, partial [Candidatus Acidoferrales bacterium]|nr:tyrosine-type recombinase/integrase [Candidatus Acidoferrales bacterium]
IRAYRQDLEDFAEFIPVSSVEEAARLLLTGGHGGANALALAYKTHLYELGLAPSTINRRLAALRSMVKLARSLGMIPWSLEVESVKSEPYRDTRGPGRDGFRRILDRLVQRTDPKGIRDIALLRCLYDLALRRAEVVGLDLEDLDLAAGTLAVLGKGRTEKSPVTLPGPTKAALEAWLAIRGPTPGPLFRSLDRARKGNGRLTGGAVYLIVRKLGRKAGLETRPHGLRHAAITEALDLTRGDVRAVQKFSRHRDVRTLERYDDARQDLAGEVAKKVAEGIGYPEPKTGPPELF